jgi:hypothetical protein
MAAKQPATKLEPSFRCVYRKDLDVVIVTVSLRIQTEHDVRAWVEEYSGYFKTNFPGRKVDVILDLQGFELSAKAASAFGVARAQMLSEFNGLTYRVHIASTARVAMYTSSVLTGAPANEYRTISEAIAALLEDRRKLAGGH